MVAKATAPRRENVPRHILIHDNRMLAERAFYCLTCRILFNKDYNYGKKEKKNDAIAEIGGQAVLEGVMMKNQDSYAVAVRRPDGEIELEKRRL